MLDVAQLYWCDQCRYYYAKPASGQSRCHPSQGLYRLYDWQLLPHHQRLLGSHLHASLQSDTEQLLRQSCSAAGPQVWNFLPMDLTFQTVAEDISIWSVGPKHSVNHCPLNCTLEIILFSYLLPALGQMIDVHTVLFCRSWYAVVSWLQRQEFFCQYFMLVQDGCCWTNPAYLENSDDRIPSDLLQSQEAESVFRTYVHKLRQEHRKTEYAYCLLTGFVTGHRGSFVKTVENLIPGFWSQVGGCGLWLWHTKWKPSFRRYSLSLLFA